MSGDPLRELKLKTGVVTRTSKELDSYRSELVENQKKVEEIRASEDQSRLKQWESVTLETQSMIPDTSARLRTAVEDLELLVQDSPSSDSSTPEFQAAEAALSDALSVLKNVGE